LVSLVLKKKLTYCRSHMINVHFFWE